MQKSFRARVHPRHVTADLASNRVDLAMPPATAPDAQAYVAVEFGERLQPLASIEKSCVKHLSSTQWALRLFGFARA